MNRYIKIILIVSGLYGLAVGLYDFLFPIYLDTIGLSFKKMGWIFSIAFALIFIFRIYLGHISDFMGRKIFYGISLIGGAISHFFTPFFHTFFPLAFLKTLREISLTLRESFLPVLVFEQSRKNFLNFIAKTRGMLFFLQGMGIFGAGFILAEIGIRKSLIISSFPLIISIIIFYLFYREKFKPLGERNFSPKVIFGKLPTIEQRKITILGFSITLGSFISHTFILPLYFLQKFSISPLAIASVLAIHRIIFGIPMLVTGKLIKKSHIEIFFYGLLFQGVAISSTVFMPNFILAAVIFLLHDFGAAFWSPIYQSYIQQFSRKENRAKDTSTILAYTSLARIIAPLITGYIVSIDLDLPFFVSGILIIIASLFVLTLPSYCAEEGSRTPTRELLTRS